MHPDAWEKQMDGLMTSALDGHFVRITIGDSEDLWVEAAATQASRQSGLAERSELPYDGMIFVYPADHNAPFTRAEMTFPIDIYFFDHEGTMVWADTGSGNARPESAYRFVVEVASGSGFDGDLVLHEVQVVPT